MHAPHTHTCTHTHMHTHTTFLLSSSIIFQIQAATSVGVGEFSNPVTLTIQGSTSVGQLASFPGRVGGEKTSSLLPRGLGTRLMASIQPCPNMNCFELTAKSCTHGYSNGKCHYPSYVQSHPYFPNWTRPD